jgi:hypothetical protein
VAVFTVYVGGRLCVAAAGDSSSKQAKSKTLVDIVAAPTVVLLNGMVIQWFV